MGIRMVSNLSGQLRDKRLSSKTRNDIERIMSIRTTIGMDTNSGILNEFYGRYEESNIKRAKRNVRKLEEAYHDGDAIHFIKPTRLDRASPLMREYMGVNPYTRKKIIKQTLDLPHTELLPKGRTRLASNIKYREVMSGVATSEARRTVIYSDAESYLDVEDKRVILTSWERMLKEINKKDE